MKKFLALFLAIMMIATVACGCGGKKGDDTKDDGKVTAEGDLGYIKEKGKLIVGITDFEPMDFEKDGQWTGFDAELAKKVGEKLGVSVEFQLISWEAKETELSGKTIDCIWNGLTWSQERAANMSLSDKYMKNRQVVVCTKDNADRFTQIDDLRTSDIAAETGSAGEEFIKNSVLSTATFIESDNQLKALTEVVMGTAEAAVVDYVMANYLINKAGSDFNELTILDKIVESEEEFYAIAFRKDSNVTAEVNKILKEFMADGTIEKLAAEYGLTDALVK